MVKARLGIGNMCPAFVLELEDGRSNTGQTRSKFITDTDPATHSFDWRPWYQMPYYSAVQLDDILSVLHQKNRQCLYFFFTYKNGDGTWVTA